MLTKGRRSKYYMFNDDDDDVELWYTTSDYFYNVGADDDVDFNKDGKDDVDHDSDALIMLLCHLLVLHMP